MIRTSNRPLHVIGNDAVRALINWNEPPKLFVRAGQLVRIHIDEKHKPLIEDVREDILRRYLSEAARFDNGRNEVSPPHDVAKDVLAQSEKPFPALEAVTELPIIRADGTICLTAGYDQQTTFYYSPEPSLSIPPVPDCPSANQIVRAAELLREVICDFPFDSPASEANALALLITPVLRPAIRGCVPLAIVTAPQQGSGKSKLAGAACLISTGRPAANMTAPSSEDEWRKRITSTLREGRTFIVLDNLENRLDSESLASALTSETWRDRKLGSSSNVELPQRATWVATGNNVRIGGDLARRCYPIRLDAKSDQPWTRDNFRHPHLEPWIVKRRGELVSAILTLVRGWFVAGMPPGGNATVGSFNEWAFMLGGVLANAGVTEFLGNVKELYAAGDEEGTEWANFLRLIEIRFGPQYFAISALVELLASDEELRSALPQKLVDGNPATLSNRLGTAFSSRVNRRLVGGVRLERGRTLHRTAEWRVVSDNPATTEDLPMAA